MGMVVIFTYQFNKAEKGFKDADCELFTVSDYAELALEEGQFGEKERKLLDEWHKLPEIWRK